MYKSKSLVVIFLGILLVVLAPSISKVSIHQVASAATTGQNGKNGVADSSSSASGESGSNQSNTQEKRNVILEGATLIDGTTAPPKHNSIIVIHGNMIANVSNFSKAENIIPLHNTTNNLVLNLTGKYVIPGLFDMHTHVAGILHAAGYNETTSKNYLRMLLVNGVTTTRNAGGPTNESVGLREKVSSGQIAGPKIFTAGELINSPLIPVPWESANVSTEQGAREEVDRQASEGVDFIKLYVGLTPNLVRAAIDEAHLHGLKVIGHLYLTTWTNAANLGINAISHGLPVSPFSLPEDKQKIFNETAGYGQDKPFLWLSLVDLNSPTIKEMINTLVKHNVTVEPTLVTYESMLKNDTKDKYLWPKVLQLTKMMYDGDVKILSGTDTPEFGLLPGQSLHRELELLHEAGINSSGVLRIATVNGAQALGISNKVGTIQIGKEANMIVLASNPLVNISNTKKIEQVINEGNFVNMTNATAGVAKNMTNATAGVMGTTKNAIGGIYGGGE
jgi:imidazolonepropionase-like amidohydrolase